jgi:hypothetical protein
MTERFRLRRDELEWHELDGQVVALDGLSDQYLSVNPSGRLLWEALSEGATEPELVRALAATYRLDDSTAQRDVSRFLAGLRDLGVLETQKA